MQVEYCISGTFRVFKFSLISDFKIFCEVYNRRIFIFLRLRYYNNNFREMRVRQSVFLAKFAEFQKLKYFLHTQWRPKGYINLKSS